MSESDAKKLEWEYKSHPVSCVFAYADITEKRKFESYVEEQNYKNRLIFTIDDGNGGFSITVTTDKSIQKMIDDGFTIKNQCQQLCIHIPIGSCCAC